MRLSHPVAEADEGIDVAYQGNKKIRTIEFDCILHLLTIVLDPFDLHQGVLVFVRSRITSSMIG